jgi:hypothetical protein
MSLRHDQDSLKEVASMVGESLKRIQRNAQGVVARNADLSEQCSHGIWFLTGHSTATSMHA